MTEKEPGSFIGLVHTLVAISPIHLVFVYLVKTFCQDFLFTKEVISLTFMKDFLFTKEVIFHERSVPMM
jgi:hypothetical protein